jgi:hypothetical protein
MKFIIIIFILIVAGCGQQYDYNPSIKSSVIKTIDSKGQSIETVYHDGHTFILASKINGISIIHHPSCKCLIK